MAAAKADGGLHSVIEKSRAFAVNFLRKDQLHLIKAFGFVSGRNQEKLSGIDYELRASGSPVLKESTPMSIKRVKAPGASLVCSVLKTR